jgi:hypothetical protein
MVRREGEGREREEGEGWEERGMGGETVMGTPVSSSGYATGKIRMVPWKAVSKRPNSRTWKVTRCSTCGKLDTRIIYCTVHMARKLHVAKNHSIAFGHGRKPVSRVFPGGLSRKCFFITNFTMNSL